MFVIEYDRDMGNIGSEFIYTYVKLGAECGFNRNIPLQDYELPFGCKWLPYELDKGVNKLNWIMIEFVCFVFLVACAVNFSRTLADKWGILEWLQVNAPNEFFHKLFTCTFCQSFWLGLAFSLIIVGVTRNIVFLSIPIFSSVLRW